ncbi:MAG TPA: serine/threonine-protein kinase [Phycisphaerae bacterium]|nr:serine/threonine-protein kinase [Phycisphaerae bacterium]
MSTENLPHPDDLFNDALEVAPAQRERFLSAACGDNDRLRSEVRSLLSAHDSADRFLNEPGLSHRGSISDPSPQEYLGRQVGPFRLEELIAVGGMGMVFRAVRTGDEFRQQVAVKIIHRDLASPLLVRKFRQERQALADLNHPGIARLLDGGATTDGMPYLAMEFIAGTPIDRYCDEARLSLRERLELFLKVCDAVGHAHRHLIVHRDLKPANILVSNDGQPKLLDFGIAKLLQSESTGSADDRTLHCIRLVTPRYASPEQLLDQRVTISCDVFSLGLILYELLTGLPARAAPTSERDSHYLLEEIAAPSAAFGRNRTRTTVVSDDRGPRATVRGATPAQLCRLLRGDLDAIVAKATRQRADDRYQSVEQLESDLQRYLNGHPVVARSATSVYRAAKFVRRNAAAVSMLTVTILALSAAVVVSNVMRVRARDAEARAQSDRHDAILASTRAGRISRLLEETILSANPYRNGSAINIIDVLNDIAQRVSGELTDEPALAAELHYKLGQAYANLWKWEESLAHAETAAKLTRGLPEMDELVLAERLVLLGRAMTFLKRTGAEIIQQEALNIRMRRLGGEHFDVGDSKICLAFALRSAARPPQFERAEQLYKDGIETLRRASPAPTQRLAIGLLSYASMLSGQGRHDEAIVLLKGAWDTYGGLPAQEDRYRIACQIGYASALERAGRFKEAREVLSDALRRVPDGLEDTFGDGEYQRLIQLNRRTGPGEKTAAP